MMIYYCTGVDSENNINRGNIKIDHPLPTYEDECQYWADAAQNTKNAAEACEYRDVLQSLRREFLTITTASTDDILSLIDKSQSMLHELWNPSFASQSSQGYPQERMRGLLDVLTITFQKIAQEHLESTEDTAVATDESQTNLLASSLLPVFWTRDFKEVKRPLSDAISILTAWSNTIDHLMKHIWGQQSNDRKSALSARAWKGDLYFNSVLNVSLNRLKQIHQIRSVHSQMVSVLDDEIVLHFSPIKIFAPFAGIRPSGCHTYPESRWTTAVAQYERLVQGVERYTITALKNELGELNGAPYQFMRQVQQFIDLVSRPNIKQGLLAEREVLMSHIVSMMQGIKAQLNDMKHTDNVYVPQHVIWARAAASKLEQTEKIVLELMDDLPSAPSYMQQSIDVCGALESFERQRFAEWVQQAESHIADRDGPFQPLTGEKGAKELMELNYASGKLIVNYSEDLVSITRQVRQLVSLGCPVPAKVQKACEEAGKMYRYVVLLQQVAHFYNTVDQQMLPSQQLMLLQLALAFENLVRHPNGDAPMNWTNTSMVEAYISRLQECVRVLMVENRKLRKFHSIIADKIIIMFDTNLLRHQQRWKDELHNIRSVFNTLENQGYTSEAMKAWKLHWDFQLYKALEHQYQLGLESLHETLPEIQVELVFKNQVLQFRPPYEEIRARYHREMKRFINIPTIFRGFSDESIFQSILANSSLSLFDVYQRAEELFQNVSKAADTFKDWVLLGTTDYSTFAEEVLSLTIDWELNFKMIKKRGKDLESLPSSVQVDCIVISTLPVKSAIEDILQRLFDALVVSLRKSIRKHLSTIEQYIVTGTELLSQKPESLEAIGNANHKHEDLRQSKPDVKIHFAEAEVKNKLLRVVVGNGVDLLATQTQWDRFEILMDSHHLMLQDQFDQLKLAIDQRVATVMQQVTTACQRWQQLKPRALTEDGLRDIETQMAFITAHEHEIADCQDIFARLCTDCDHFQVQRPSSTQLQAVVEDIAQTKERWALLHEFDQSVRAVLQTNWIAFRTRMNDFDELLTRWTTEAKRNTSSAVSVLILQQTDKYIHAIPLLKLLRGDYWMQQHWYEYFRLMKRPVIPIADMTVADLLSDNIELLQQSAAQIKAIDERARGEIVIRDALQEIEVWSIGANFTLVPHMTSTGISMKTIKEWKEVMTQIGDSQSLLQSLKDSPYFLSFEEKIHTWDVRLTTLSSLILDLNVVQRKCIYLEPIFSSGALSADKSRFRKIKDMFVELMAQLETDPRIVNLTHLIPNPNELKGACDQLERCQKALYDFLESKREQFARFYFLGDDDLLEILGQPRNPNIIQNHLKKLFAGVDSVVFSEDMTQIIAVRSATGETVALFKHVSIADTAVERWLHALSEEMQSTLQVLLAQCLAHPDVHKYPQMILDLSQQIKFTSAVETALPTVQLSDVLVQLRSYLAELTHFDFSGVEGEQERVVMRDKVRSLTLELVHEVSVVEKLLERKTTDLDDWQWYRQLRYYLNKDNLCIIRTAGSEFMYSYEYQGNSEKLVHTPLTDKCYLVLTNAMANGFGGNPYGPAGTGKTESVKALGYLFGRQVLVFNCDEALDYKSMSRILFGIVRCGAWGCFDEFNRLDGGVLSAISQQIQTIQLGLKSNATTVAFGDKSTPLDGNTAVFVTLNPAGKHYGGRQKLPDNLKQLFRAIAMSAPDNELIAEIVLFSEGFSYAKRLGQKTVRIYNMAKLLLSQQKQYDWGLRPLKAILRSAGFMLKTDVVINESDSLIVESQCVLRSIEVNTLSKLTAGDCELFRNILKDVFPDVTPFILPGIESLIRDAFLQAQLVYDSAQAEKVEQLHQSCMQRTGIILLGPSGTGKSAVLKLLIHLWKLMNFETTLVAMNPKAVDKATLLGRMDLDTREWHDGILTRSSRTLLRDMVPSSRAIILCDGDIDPEWIEALNSTLDDNRLLTLPNGERIQFDTRVNFIFETHSIQYASPATVSRMAVVYFSDNALSEKLLGDAWAQQNQPGETSMSDKERQQWVDTVFCKMLPWFFDNCKSPLSASRSGITKCVLSQLKNTDNKKMVTYGVYQALSCYVPANTAKKLAAQVGSVSGLAAIDGKGLDDVQYDHAIKQFQAIDTRPVLLKTVNGLIVTTSRLTQYINRVLSLLTHDISLALIGPAASGKDRVISYCFDKLSVSVIKISCNLSTSSREIISSLLANGMLVASNTGPLLKARSGERLVLYIKDLDVPLTDKYGSSSVVSLLHQLITHSGFFSPTLEWVQTERLIIVLSINASRLSTQNISSRLTSALTQVLVEKPSRDEIQLIISTLLLDRFATRSQDTAQNICELWQHPQKLLKLCQTVLKIYQAAITMCSNLNITPSVDIRSLVLLVEDIPKYMSRSTEVSTEVTAVAQYSAHLFGAFLPTTKDKNALSTQIYGIIETDWQVQVPSAVKDVEPQYFTSCVDPGRCVKLGHSDYMNLAQRAIKSIEDSYGALSVTLTEESLAQLSCIDTHMAESGRSLLLVMAPGMDSMELALIACHMLKIEVRFLTVTATSSIKSLNIDFKALFQTCGIQKQRVVLIIKEQHVFVPAGLQYISDVLSTGFITDLYAPEELDAVLAAIKEEYAQSLFVGSLQEFFKHRVRQNLQVILAADARSQFYQIVSTQTPAFVRASHVARLDSWASISMKHITSALLTPVNIDPQVIDRVYTLGKEIYETIRVYPVSPIHYTRFVQIFSSLYSGRKESLSTRHGFLAEGLKKLDESASYVDKLSSEADAQSKELVQKQTAADQALQSITDAMAKAADQRKETEALSITLKEEELCTQQQQASIQAELNDVEPILKAAKAAVSEIRSDHIAEVRALRAPPAVVRDVLEGVLVLLGVGDTSWTNMKAFLGKRGFKEDIMTFDARNISPEVLNKVTSLIRQKPNSFDETSVKRSSVAAAPLATWVQANIQFSTVFDKVKPLEKNMQKVIQSLESSRARLIQLNADLENLDHTVALLKTEFGDKAREAEVLKNSLTRNVETLTQSRLLLEDLKGEHTRWQQQLKSLSTELQELPSVMILASAISIFHGRLSSFRREELLSNWRLVCGVRDFDFLNNVSSENDRLAWLGQGLPGDQLSVSNATMLSTPHPVRIITDAVGQGVQWLKDMLRTQKAEVVPHDRNMFKSIELAVRFGKTVVIDGVDAIESWLYPLIRGEIRRQGARSLVLFGDKIIDYSGSFQLYLVMRDNNFNVPIELSGYATQVNFSVTLDGLSDQLSSTCLQIKRPDLQRQKMQLLEQEEKLKIEMASLESRLLTELAQSQGSILENRNLIMSLQATKDKVATVTSALQVSQQLKHDIEQQSSEYKLLSTLGSQIYTLLSTLKEINHMYQFSFKAFEQLFRQVLHTETESSNDGTSVVSVQCLQLKQRMIQNTLLALTKKDQQLFLLQFSFYTAHNSENVKLPTWEAFLQLKPAANDDTTQIPAWVPLAKKAQFQLIMKLLPSHMGTDMVQDSSTWKVWLAHSTPELAYPEQAQKQMRQIYRNESSADQFIVLIANPGSDPTQELVDLAKVVMKETSQKLVTIAMNPQNTDENVHLCISWLHQLVDTMKFMSPNPNFRLWILTEQVDSFPARLLEDSLKVMLEPPPGLRENLSTSLGSWKNDKLNQDNVLGCQARFAMSWFHAVAQERRTFVPQAWNTAYEFSQADFKSSVELLMRLLTLGNIRWPVVCGLLSDAVYGGRVDNSQDQQKLQILLESCFNEHVFNVSGRAPQRKLGRVINLPSSTNKDDFISIVSRIANSDILASLVLPQNVGGVLQQTMSTYTTSSLRRLYQKQLHRSAKDLSDTHSGVVQTLLPVWSKLYSTVTSSKSKDPHLSSVTTEDPLIACLQLELSNSRQQIEQVNECFRSLLSLDRTDSNVSWLKSISLSETPPQWCTFWEGPDDVTLFLQQLVGKYKSAGDMLKQAVNGSLLTTNVRLADVYNAGRFLTAFRQAAARKMSVSIDNVQLMTSWQKSEVPTTVLSLQVEGLQIQGARFDGMQLSEVSANDSIVISAPTCYLWWKTVETTGGDSSSKNEMQGQISIPLYTNTGREQMVVMLNLPCAETNKEQFVLFGVAMFIEIH